MQKTDRFKIPADYYIIFSICVLFVVLAFILETPAQIAINYYKINISRSVLITDYVALAGIGAALVNSAVSGLFYLFLLIINKRKPDGKVIASLFVAIGFSMFGKNVFNTLPMFVGVWIYAKLYKIKFSDLFVTAILSGTIAPLVSEIAFFDEKTSVIKISIAYLVGLFIGFIFPVVTESAKRMHRNYCLYNGGIAGGFIATLFVGLLKSAGIQILPERFWDTGHTLFLAVLIYSIALALIIYGLVTDKPVNAFKKFKQLLNEKDANDNDYFNKYGNTCYINIGIMCIFSTSIMLILKIPINGPVMGGIFTVAGFAAAGKHLKNTIPILIGSITATYFNHLELTDPANALSIPFSTGLAPISGKYGWRWGIVVGFLHVSVSIFIGNLNGGLNLYNNGFAESFIAITVVPVIVFFREIVAKNKKVK